MTKKTLGQVNNLIKKLISKVEDKEELKYWHSIAPNLAEDEQEKLLEILDKENKNLERLEK